MSEKNVSRRNFLAKTAAAGTLGVIGVNALLSSCKGGNAPKDLNLPPLLPKAPDGKPLKAGLIGCGGRGTGAALNFLEAGNGLSIVALGDVFQDRLDGCRKQLKEKGKQEIADDKCFIGFDAYEKVINSDVDVVIVATPPFFRPMHFEAIVQARKHAFIEKPVAVDPVGARSVIASAQKAKSIGLVVITGTQRRHAADYVETYKQVMNGAIGDIISANCYWNQNQLWYRVRQPEWSDMEYMIRDWVNWTWLSGDHIVEQHIHNIDVINWFLNDHPVKANGVGSRQRRLTGDQYDNFAIDYEYASGIHMHSMCRQINGCSNNVSELIRGSKGSAVTNLDDCKLVDLSGNKMWEYTYPKVVKEKKSVQIPAMVQEHIDLVTCIRQGINRVEAEETAVTTLTAIMGRIAAYTGKVVTWDEMMSSELKLGPSTFVLGPSDIKAVIAVPGTENKV
jgi:predicted dehydrogenase